MSIPTYNGVFLLMQIRRCHHVKVNGELCGSPALRAKCYCYFHNNYHHLGAYGAKQNAARNPFKDRFPVLEDGNSIQAAVMQVIRLILAKEIDSKEAGLLLYALQIASSNLHYLQLKPLPANIVVDPLLVAESEIGYKPTRAEDFIAETEEEQKEMDAREQQLQQVQERSDAEWEAEVRQEFESLPDSQTAPEPLSSMPVSSEAVLPPTAEQNGHESSSAAPPSRPAASCSAGLSPAVASPETIRRIEDAAARYQKYPADRKLAEGYAALLESLQPPPGKNKS